ncbi:hypothetical protein V493_01222 [Pseudogymnoascus sp. VKM F-4281 (FW-2241)]|nr:hypothetical protein V493_01222 [Pseudogymnoascus sp. VKM F-4281 (FW-2241)]
MRDVGSAKDDNLTGAQSIATYAVSLTSLLREGVVSHFIGRGYPVYLVSGLEFCKSLSVVLFVGVFVGMVFVSKSAIQCPSPSCNFAYFASSPDPAGKLRNHFNNFKSRDAEHESYFQKPFCLVDHSTEFAEPEEHHERQEMEIAVILSPSQLQRLANEWQLEYELDEGDLIIRKGRSTHLSRGMIIARCTSKQDSVPSLKRRRTSYEIIAHDKDPISMKIDCGGRSTYLKGNGLAVVRYSAIDITIHVESESYSVVTLDYTLSGET